MGLVEYPDSDASSNEAEKKTTGTTPSKDGFSLKRKREDHGSATLPALPDSFYDLYATPARASLHDDPTLHSGRQRTTPHVEGNWPSHVYIEWCPKSAESDLLKTFLGQLSTQATADDAGAKTSLESELGADAPLHVSLSRSLTLLADERGPFLDEIRSLTRQYNLKPFDVPIRTVRWEPNHERNRWFLVLQLDRPPSNGLNALLHICNQAALAFDQPQLYRPANADLQHTKIAKAGFASQAGNRTSLKMKDPTASDIADSSNSFHVSIAWTLKEPQHKVSPQILPTWRSVQNIEVPVKCVKIKIGNTITSIPLETKRSDLRNMFGT